MDTKTKNKVGAVEFDERLSRYMDGELDPQSAAMLEAELEANEALADEFEAYLEMRSALIAQSEADLEQVDFTGFWDRIDEAIADEARIRQEKATHRLERGGWWRAVGGWFRERTLLSFGTALAMAALAVVFFRVSLFESTLDTTASKTVQAPGDRAAHSTEKAGGDEAVAIEVGEILTEGVQVTSLNAEYGSVMVFQAPDNAVFIWVDDGEDVGSSAI